MRTNVLGVGISAVNLKSATEAIEQSIKSGLKGYICVTGVHGVMESQDDVILKEIHNKAFMVVPDGMPMVWLSRFAGYKDVDRVYGPDLMLEMCHLSEKSGYRHFFYGGNEGVPDLLKDRLLRKFPKLKVVGTYSPPFRTLEEYEKDAISAMINASQPDIVWVGLSTPKQERWMSEFRDKLNAPILIGVGAAFDFHAGLKKQAPRFIQRSGFEWLYRTAIEPKRLAKRYLNNNPRFLYRIAQQIFGKKTYSIEEVGG